MAYLFAMHPTNRIRELRKKAGLTQAELAELAGISQPAISQVENDERPLTVEWMRLFARIFHCAPADLLGDQDNPDRLTDEERDLLERYREADPAHRALVKRVAEPIAEFAPMPSDDEPLRRRA